MASRGLVAFLGGAATKQASILDEQRKLKQTEERERLLIELREQSALRAAEAAEKLQRSRVSATFSGADADEFVYRDAEGRETSRRALTAAEKAARAAAADKEAWDRDYKERELALRGRELDISAANSRRAAAGRGGETADPSAKSIERQFLDALMEQESDVIGDLTKNRNVPLTEIKHMGLETVMSALSRADVSGEFDEQEMSNDFFNRLRRSYGNVTDPKYNMRNPAPRD